MKKLLIILLICLMPTISFAKDVWTKKDSAYQGTLLTLMAVDWLQTKEIARNPKYYETNPILGKYPNQNEVDFYFFSTAILHTGIAYYIPKEYRRWWQYVFIGIQTTCVLNNISIGVSIKF
ncbi:MAG: hypothetical protein ABIG69_19365 [Bacteroidota bacterium]